MKRLPIQVYLLFIVTFSVCSVCTGLAYWQYVRGEVKQKTISREQSSLVKVFSASELLSEPHKYDGQRALITGVIKPGLVRYLDNKVVNGIVGYDVVTVMQLQGSSIELLVNLGFVAASALRTPPKDVSFPDKQITLGAVFKSFPLKQFYLGSDGEAQPQVIQHLNYGYFAQFTANPLVEGVAFIPDGLDGHTIGHYQSVVLSPQRHFGYAVQWLLLAMAALCIGGYLFSKEIKQCSQQEI